MPTRHRTTRARGVREAAVRRTGTPGHPEAAGRGQGTAQQELENESWLRAVAELSGRSYEQMRVIVLEFLDTDIFHVSIENCVSFLDPLTASWDIDLATFALVIVLNETLVSEDVTNMKFIK